MENNLNILILLPYFERPVMVLNALDQLAKSKYENFKIALIDDGSVKFPVLDILDNYDKLSDKITLYNTHDTLENKLKRESIMGKYMNIAIRESNSDVAIIVCDDDAIYPRYLENLNDFYNSNPNIHYSYCHVVAFDPTDQVMCTTLRLENKSEWATGAVMNLNWTSPINPYCRVDASQVSWRISCNKEKNIWFPEQQTKNHDAYLYRQLFQEYGSCVFNNIVGMYKGFHKDQLSNRSGTDQYRTNTPVKTPKYISVCARFTNKANELSSWLDHHISIGVGHFYLYNLNSTDDYKEVLKKYYDQGYITLRNINQNSSLLNSFNENYKFNTYWCAFLDIESRIECQNLLKIMESSEDFASVMVENIEVINPRKLVVQNVYPNKFLYDPVKCYPCAPLPVNEAGSYVIEN